MTGYGAAEGKVGAGTIFIEVRTVNHRYCDLSLKIPPKMNVLDQKIRKHLQQAVSRGKCELYLKERQELESKPTARVNIQLAKAYQKSLRRVERELGLEERDILDVVDLKEFVSVTEKPVRYERYWSQIQRILVKAVNQLEKMRATEGRHIRSDQRRRLLQLQQIMRQVGKKTKANQKRNAKQLEKQRDNGRDTGRENVPIDRSDITEELVRLDSHCDQYRKFFTTTGPVGRQLDFLIQEMNREVNTIAAKAGDAEISQMVVVAKAELEKLREQVQNIE